MGKVMFYFNNIIETIYNGAHYVIHQAEYGTKKGVILYSSIKKSNGYKTKRK